MCLLEKELVRSHLIPAAVYDYCRTEDASPIRVGDGVIMHTDRQIQAYLLCSACEDILSKGGESWVSPRLARLHKTFPLYDLLMNCQAAFEDDKGGIYYGSSNPELSCEKLTHFALGIYWKAAVHSWCESKKEPMINLGPYADALRTWLRGETNFPRNVCLTVTLARPKGALIFMSQPVQARARPWRSFKLHVPGIMFSLNVGKMIEAEMRDICFHQNPTHPVFVSDEITGTINKRFGRDFVESRKTKSYLDQKAKRLKGS
jgi:hypothetical protein